MDRAGAAGSDLWHHGEEHHRRSAAPTTSTSSSGLVARFITSKDDAEPHVIQWLKSRYAYSEDGSVAKSNVYGEYMALCEANGFEVLNRSVFGKLFCRVFPFVSSRRLGKRNENAMHYTRIACTALESSSPADAYATPPPPPAGLPSAYASALPLLSTSPTPSSLPRVIPPPPSPFLSPPMMGRHQHHPVALGQSPVVITEQPLTAQPSVAGRHNDLGLLKLNYG